MLFVHQYLQNVYGHLPRIKSNMKTINTILGYTLSPEQVEHLRSAGIYNWIGWEWQNIESILLANIELLPWFDNSKAEKLLDDMRQLAIRHDTEFFFKLGFYRANLRFAKWLFHLLHWSGWKRFTIALISLILLNKNWKPYYFNK